MAEKSRTDDMGRILDAVMKATEGDFSVRIETADRDDELGTLARAINKMFEQVHEHITERQHAENTLRESEERYRQLFELGSDAILLIDNETGRILEANNAASEMYGYTREELLANKNFDLSAEPEDTQKVTQTTPVADQIVSVPLRFHRKKDGIVFPVEITGRFFIRQGRPVHIAAIRDLTGRRQMEQALRLTQFCVDQASVGIFRTGPGGKFLSVNDHVCQSLGYTREELFNMHAFDIDPNFSPEKWLKHRQKLRARGSVTFETIHRRKDGTTFPVEITGTYLEFQGEGFSFSFVHDITERKQAEEALRQSEHLLKESQKVARLGHYTFDVRTGFWESSEVLDEVFGIEASFIKNVEGWMQIVHPDYRDEMLSYLTQNVLQERQPFDREYKIVRLADNQERWVHGLGRLELDEDGNPIYMIGTIQDITERKRLEEQLMQSQKMESVGRLAGGVAHDFNNMLTVILGYVELIKTRLPNDDPLVKDVLEIEKAANHSKDVTRQLLAFSRKQIIAPQPTNLNELITNTRKTLARLIGEDIDLRFYPAEDLWQIKFDPSQIDQILVNLVVNARDALPNGGKLAIETANVYLGEVYSQEHFEFTPGQYVLLAVSDNGIGMDKEILSHIFEPFFTTKEVDKGTGLGLATVYGIVKQNGGLINVYSEPGQGTTFKIYFPRIPEENRIKADSQAYAIASGTETVLLVEDDDLVREMTTAMLQALGYTVLAAETPLAALTICKEQDTAINILITDVVMPGMNGMELQDRVRAIIPGIKVLFMSGYTSNVIVYQGVLDEELHFLQKPFSMNELAQKVRNVIGDS